jgi:predicted nucleotidyltransferase
MPLRGRLLTMEMRQDSTDFSIARALAERIRRALGQRVRRIILFGSRAGGAAGPDSDFDLLVVLRELAPAEVRSLRLSLYRALRGAGVTAEPWVMSEEEFEETKSVVGGLAHPAFTEGVLLYENA